MAQPSSCRWRFSLRLRSLLGGIVVLAMVLGRWGASARTQALAVAALSEIDPDASFGYSINPRGMQSGFEGDDPPSSDEQKLPGWLPHWVYRQLGRDFFLTTNLVSLTVPNEPRAHAAAIEHLAQLRHLAFLAINSAVDDADIERLAHLNQLREFAVFTHCPGVTDRALAVVARWPRLESIRLATPSVTDVGLASLGHLATLRCIDLQVGGCEWSPFEGIVQTRGGIAWTGRGTTVPGAFPSLTALMLHVRLKPGADLRILGRMANLTTLTLRGRTIRDDDLRDLATLRHLETLTIEDTTIDGSGFRHLVGLAGLSCVSGAGPNITDAALPHLARLPRLAALFLIGTQVTARGLEALQPASDLATLRVDPRVVGTSDRLQQILPHCDLSGSLQPPGTASPTSGTVP